MRELFTTIPYQTLLVEHINRANELFGEKITEENIKDLIHICCEAARVEYIMGQSFQAWQIPILSGQEGQFKLKLAINKGINNIIKSEINKDNSYS